MLADRRDAAVDAGARRWPAGSRPTVLLNRAGRLRQEAIERTLPDFLDILAVSVRAGLGYRYALRRVAESLGGPVGEEMLTVLRQIDLGADRREAFLALRDRNESDALKAFVAAQLQAEELGVPLSEALNDIASDMRRMANQNARRQAQRASPRVSLLVTTLIVPGSMILILLSIYFSVVGSTGESASLADRPAVRLEGRGADGAGGWLASACRLILNVRAGDPADHAVLAARGGAPRAGGGGAPGRQRRFAGPRAALGAGRAEPGPPPVLPGRGARAGGADPDPDRRRQPVLLLHARAPRCSAGWCTATRARRCSR